MEVSLYTEELLDLRNDFVFKTFFSSRSSNHLLLEFLNAVLEETIIAVEVTNTNLQKMHANDKASSMDMRVKTERGEQVNIEMQVQGHRALPERMLMYWAKMYALQDKVNNSYSQLKKATQILITDFNLLPKKHFHSKFQLTDKEAGAIFTKHIEIHVLELSKLPNLSIVETDELEKWLLFMKSDKKKKEALAMESPIFKEALEEIERLSQDPETRAIAISHEIHLRDQIQREEDAREDGMEKGIEKGKKVEREVIILGMISKGFSAEEISNTTSVPLKEIKEILNTKNGHRTIKK
ncbi:Rpn family recombination-promoting nuclease/putative transposase [Psychrobacillus sp. NPDC093180]|uniref:Rpn family recombination-promoting nuclease/putative transposase n=1 Tax=Psychrobacillus sp. NPDC093180 TaxID=3364489 RepID=UPI00382D56C8